MGLSGPLFFTHRAGGWLVMDYGLVLVATRWWCLAGIERRESWKGDECHPHLKGAPTAATPTAMAKTPW